jgi:hypothetical protein
VGVFCGGREYGGLLARSLLIEAETEANYDEQSKEQAQYVSRRAGGDEEI